MTHGLGWYQRLYQMLQRDSDAEPLRLTSHIGGECTIDLVCHVAADVESVVYRLRSVADALERWTMTRTMNELRDHRLVLDVEGPPATVSEFASTFGLPGAAWPGIPQGTILVRGPSRGATFTATLATKEAVAPADLWAIARAFPMLRIRTRRIWPDGASREATFENGACVATTRDNRAEFTAVADGVVPIDAIDRDSLELGRREPAFVAAHHVIWIRGIACESTGPVIDEEHPDYDSIVACGGRYEVGGDVPYRRFSNTFDRAHEIAVAMADRSRNANRERR